MSSFISNFLARFFDFLVFTKSIVKENEIESVGEKMQPPGDFNTQMAEINILNKEKFFVFIQLSVY